MKTSLPDVLTSSESSRPPEASGGLAPSTDKLGTSRVSRASLCSSLSEKTHYVGLFSDSGDTTEEEWRDIPGYEGQYQASSLGRIRSLDREILMKNGIKRSLKGHLLTPSRSKTRPYLATRLGRCVSPIEVHRLVALTFIGPCPKNCEVLHNNGDPLDNRPENLRYDTHSENLRDIYLQGRKRKKLTAEDVHQIRFGSACGIKAPELARMYCIDVSNIYRLLKGVAFAYL